MPWKFVSKLLYRLIVHAFGANCSLPFFTKLKLSYFRCLCHFTFHIICHCQKQIILTFFELLFPSFTMLSMSKKMCRHNEEFRLEYRYAIWLNWIHMRVLCVVCKYTKIMKKTNRTKKNLIFCEHNWSNINTFIAKNKYFYEYNEMETKANNQGLAIHIPAQW